MKAHDVYEKMIEAANKATKHSQQYKDRDEALDKAGVSDIARGNDYFLQKYYKCYCFWRDEQIRLSSLLQGQAAMVFIQNHTQVEVKEDLAYEIAQDLMDRGEVPTKERLYGNTLEHYPGCDGVREHYNRENGTLECSCGGDDGTR